MRVLHLALFAEGPTDHRFLGPVLRRQAVEYCLRHGSEDVETPAMLSVHSPTPPRDKPRAERICEAVVGARDLVDLLFVHSDGNGAPERSAQERIKPALARIAVTRELSHVRSVAVVPVRETEAWCLADGDAIRAVLGTTLDDQALGLPPRPLLVEALTDPKAVLSQVIGSAQRGRRSRRPPGPAQYHERLGEEIDLDRLRQVPAFGACAEAIRLALAELGYITA